MIVTGELLKRGKDWDIPQFGALFNRLAIEINVPGPITRFIRYHGEIGDNTEIRFFGIDTEPGTIIPDGLVSLELGNHTYTVHEPASKRGNHVWQSELNWHWIQQTATGAPLGEFSTSLPGVDTVRFVISANVYLEKGKTINDDVRVIEYDPIWPERFEEMKGYFKRTIPPEIVVRIEHYGSTSIPGMPAKPIVDILLEIPSFAEARKSLLPLFNKPGCEYWWYNDHMMFIVRDRYTGTRTYHIHAAPAGHPMWEGTMFRDYLISHPEDAKRYAELKHYLAGNHPSDRETYTEMKGIFVREIVTNAKEGL